MKVKKPIAFLLALVTLVTTLVATFPVTAMAAEARAGKTAELTVGRYIYYGDQGMYTTRFTVEGNEGYCANPVKGTPTGGTYTKITNFTDRMPSVQRYGNGDYYKACVDAVLWFGYGGPGFDKSMWSSKWYDGTDWTADRYRAMTHVMLAFYYEGNSDRALAYTSAKFKSWCYKNIMGRANGEWADKNAIMYRIVHRRTEVPSNFHTYVLSTNPNNQDIAGFDYNPGDVTVKKVSANPTLTKNNKNYSLKGASYTIFKKDGTKVKTITCNNEEGTFDPVTLDAGDYYLQEKTAPKGYKLDKTKHYFTMKEKDMTVTVKDEPIEQGQGIRKVSTNPNLTDGNPNYSLEGAVYAVYNKKTNKKINEITSGKDGVFPQLKLDPGDYYLKETKAPKGFQLNNDPVYFTVEAGKDLNLELEDKPLDDPIRIFLVKIDGNTGKEDPQGGGQLGHAEFSVTYYDGIYTQEELKDVSPAATWVLKTNAEGKINFKDEDCFVSGDALYRSATGQPTIPVGTVLIRETKAPVGYQLDSSTRLIHITGEGTQDQEFTAIKFTNKVIAGGVKVYKYDLELGKNTPQGDAILSGARFQIENTSANPVMVNGKEYGNGEVVDIIETNEQGIAETPANWLPFGTYHIREILPPTGYLNTGIIEADFMISENGGVVVITDDQAIQNNVIRGGVKLQKRDFETKEDKPQGSATLQGAVFEIVNKSANPVLVEGNLYQVGDVVKTITTGPDGSWTSAADLLPYGTYLVREVQPSEGYLLEGILERTFQIRENGVIVDMTGVDQSIQDQVKRGDLKFVKIEDGTDRRMANIPFKITSKTTGESHVIVTDENGYISTESAWVSHFQDTNKAVDWEDGFWFGLESVIRDDKGALIYDYYTIDELPCENNKDKKLLTGIDLRISIDGYTVEMGTLTDDPITLETTAVDKKTGLHGSNPVKDTTIVDTVKYSNVNIGDTYTIKGRIVHKANGQTVVVDGREVTAEKTFTAEKEVGYIDLSFTFDAREVGYETVVVFEELYCNGELVASHCDPDDPDQTIVFNPDAEISTKAVDFLTGENKGVTRDDVTIVDTVSYDHLVPWREYIVKGYVVDKTTGDVLIAGNQQVTQEITFTAQNAKGTVDVTFRFDGSNLVDKQNLVVYEELYWQDQKLGEHRRYAQRAYEEFGLLPINKLSMRILQNYIFTLEEENGENRKKRSPKTIRNYLLCISSIMNYAIQLGYITVNPCANLTFPKYRKSEPIIYNQQETERFLRLLMTDESVPLRYQCFFVLAIFGGYREGEILGFEWDDLDFQNNVVTVQRESIYTKEKGLFTDLPKTQRSIRCSKLPDFVMELLQKYKAERKKERVHFEKEWKNTNRVFVSSTGRPLFPSAPLNWLTKFLKKHNLKHVNIHSFRHLNASLLITNGVDIQTVSEYLGHSTTTTTLNFYSHTYDYIKACAADAVANAFPESIQNLIRHE